MSISDEDRAKFLFYGGYAPHPRSGTPTEEMPLSPTEMVDWCIEHGYCPAYWREPHTQQEKDECLKGQIDGTGNGLIKVRNGDRSRIDEIIKSHAMRSAFATAS